MILVSAIFSAISTAYGLFLTRKIVAKFPVYQTIGPLFILNAFFILPFTFNSEANLNFETFLLLIFTGFLIFIGAIIVFLIVKRADSSASAVGQALSPAFVLFLAPIFVNQSFHALELFFVFALIILTIYPIRNSVLGLTSTATLFLMLAQGFNAGFINILLANIKQNGTNIYIAIMIAQIIAGIFAMMAYVPKDLKFDSLPILLYRSIFMGVGWLLLMYALTNDSILLVQSVVSAIPLIVLSFESMSDQKIPEKPILFSSLGVLLCIAALSLVR